MWLKRNEVHNLRVEKPDPKERRTVAGFIAGDEDDSHITEEKKMEGGVMTNTSHGNISEENSNAENSVQLLKRMMSMAKESASATEEGEEREEETYENDSLEEETYKKDSLEEDTLSGEDMDPSSDMSSEYSQPTKEVFYASKILNGRQVKKRALCLFLSHRFVEI